VIIQTSLLESRHRDEVTEMQRKYDLALSDLRSAQNHIHEERAAKAAERESLQKFVSLLSIALVRHMFDDNRQIDDFGREVSCVAH
jgi:hypothetical protein